MRSSACGRAPSASRSRSTAHGSDDYEWKQVSRLGNPLINEVIIPIGLKDKYNATRPADDAKNFGANALSPEPAAILNALFGLGIKESNRTDIVQALLTGVPGLTQISPQRRARRHAEDQPRRARRPPPRAASASSRVTRRASRTAAAWPTTSPTSSCASSAARC